MSWTARLVCALVACAALASCKHRPSVVEPQPAGPSTAATAQTQWNAIQKAETDWLATFAPRSPVPASSFPGTSPSRQQLLDETRRRIAAFDAMYALLRTFTDTQSGAHHTRASFRLGLYGDIRLRFETLHTLDHFRDSGFASSLPPGFDDEIQRARQLSAGYRSPVDVYTGVADELGGAGVSWGGEFLRVVVQRIRDLQPSTDLDVPSNSHDLLGEAAAQEGRNQVVRTLNADRALP